MKIGVLTSGGDCPGLNAVIRAIARKADQFGYETIGIMNGWKGIFDESYKPLSLANVAGIINRGGTILGTSRFSPFEQKSGKDTLLHKISREGFDAIISIGGEGSMHIAQLAHEAGINVIGVPKTIDNDISGTDYTFGFDTAVGIATEAIDRLHTTAESHHRIMVLEVMGRHAGWIALYSGIAGGADVVIIPEKKTKISEIVDVLKSRYKRGKLFSIVVVAEGAQFLEKELKPKKDSKKLDDFGRERLGGISYYLAEEIEKRTGFETRATILGYIQRGGMPSAFDRILGTRFGIYAVEMVKAGKFGRMAALQSNEITDIPIKEAIGKLKTVDPEQYKVAQVFFK
ncbi:MAG: 6-phosphofructokinase [Ignavibacteriae bacterium]|nr:6-phosphofructokinase [Ignavibacteriota bacterium]